MKEGEKNMKCLKINNGKGQFLNKSGDYIDIDQIGKDDILYLLDVATDEGKQFEMDEYSESEIKNPAHRIIYHSLMEKFVELLKNKEQFLDESNAIYKEALQKYKM